MKVCSLLNVLICFCFLLVSSACESGTDREIVDGDKDYESPPIPDGDNDYESPPIPDGDPENIPTDGDWIDGDSLEGDLELGPAPVISDFFITENPANVLSFYAEWVTDYPVKTKLNVDCGEEYRKTFSDPKARVKHKVFVMGLFDGAQCDFQVLASSRTRAKSTETKVIEVGPLPDYLPSFTVDMPHPDKLQDGWTLFNYNNSFAGQPLLAVIVDRHGRFRWYFRVPDATPGSDNDMRAVADGIWIGGTWGRINPFLISWEGKLLWTADISMHHVLRPWGQRRFLYLWGKNNCPGEAWEGYEDISSGTVYYYDMDEEKTIWSWVLCHHYTPPSIQEDWHHMNAVQPFPDGKSLLASSRNQHLLFKVDLDTGQIIWKMGADGDFTITDGDRFYRQHAPEIQANGNILLYDNGKSSRPYSRAIELAYTYTDEVKEAHVVWNFTPTPLIYTPIWGDADRLENGNTLITVGIRNEEQHSHLMEVSSDNPGVLLWDLIFPLDGGVYRAERISDPPFGQVIVDSE